MSVVQVFQVLIAIGLVNVWLIRFGRPTAFRGGGAANMRQEFEVYGLPSWSVGVIGLAKLTIAVLLITGIWFPIVTKPAAAGLVLLMSGAVWMHVKVRDPLAKSVPALAILVMTASVIIS